MKRIFGMAFVYSVLMQSTAFAMNYQPVELPDTERDTGIFVTILVIVVSIGLGVVDHFKNNRDR